MQDKLYLSDLIEGKSEAIQHAFDYWTGSISLPVDINIDYNWEADRSTMLLDVDLPEIEDLPQTKVIRKANGNPQEKKKTQTELRIEYAKVAFGLAIFITSNVFNLSPAIDRILISGYTQRRDKEGNLKDDYIYSIKFPRVMFENQNLKNTDPIKFCLSAENRCNMITTSMLKAISPFENF